MRWGESTRPPPLRRGRGLPAAALLAAGLVSAYAILGVLSFSSVTPGVLVKAAKDAGNAVAGVVLQRSKASNFVHPQPVPSVQSSLDSNAINLGVVDPTVAPTPVLDLTNTSSSAIRLQVDAQDAPGVSVAFLGSGSSELTLPSNAHAKVAVRIDPRHAGLITGKIRVAVRGAQDPIVVSLTGAQTPLAPGAVTATPHAGGAVALTWPASPSTGVTGYAVFARPAGGAWTRLPGGLAPASGLVVQTGSDGQQIDYRVEAAASGGTTTLLSPPGPSGTVTTDATPPAGPTQPVVVPTINLANAGAVPVKVDLPASSAPGDVVTVTLSDTSGATAWAQAAGGVGTASLSVPASGLADGSIQVQVAVSDSVGNSATFQEPGTTKDVVPPDAPASVQAPEIVNAASAPAVPVAVGIADPQPGDRVKVTLSAGNATATGSGPATDAVVVVDASGLPDGTVTVSASVVDAAGNPSDPTQGAPLQKDTVAPETASSVVVAAGPDNPQGYVNAASQTAVSVVVTFDQPTDPADSLVVTVGGRHINRLGGLASYTLGPFDLSVRGDGTVPLAVDVTDQAGNASDLTGSAIKDTVAPAAPASFGVPAGPDNPDGVVNSSTEHAALFQADFPAGIDPGATLTATVNGSDLGTASVAGSTATWQADVSGLADGSLALEGTITDAAGNATTFSGHAVKETQAPAPQPAAAHVVGCPPDTITPGSAGNVHVVVIFPQEPGPSSTVTVTLTDSAGNTATASAPGAREVVLIGGLDASGFVAGAVSVHVTVTDAAGNVVEFDGSPAAMTT